MKTEFHEGGKRMIESGQFLRKSLKAAVVLLLAASMGGCAQTVVQPKYEQQMAGPVMRPSQVLVYDFAITAADVTENQGFFASLRNSLSDTSENDRELTIAGEVKNRMSDELVAGIKELGLPAQRVVRGTPIPRSPQRPLRTGAFSAAGAVHDLVDGAP